MSPTNDLIQQQLAPVAGGLDLSPEIVKEGDGYKYKLSVFLGEEFSPEDIKVSFNEKVMQVEARKEQVSADGRTRSYEEVSRLFTLPETVHLTEVKSVLTSDGTLKIDALLPEHVESPKPQEITPATE